MTGEELHGELIAAATAKGVSFRSFVAPLFNGQSWKIEQLRIARSPTELTVRRVRALIAGEPVPAARGTSGAPPRQSERVHGHAAGSGIGNAAIEHRRAIAEAAALHRRPGETLHDAASRIERQLKEAA